MDLRKYITRDNPVIFEIGANTGTDTIKFAQEFPKAKIYAFEPDPDVFKKLVDNVSGYPNIFLYQMAVSDQEGISYFYSSDQGLSGSLREPREHLRVYPQVSFYDPIQVRVTSLDFFVGIYQIETIDFMWADVQGAERNLIGGGKNTFSKKVKYFFTEFSKTELYQGAPNLGEILQLLPGYALEEIVWQWEHDGNALLRNEQYGL